MLTSRKIAPVFTSEKMLHGTTTIDHCSLQVSPPPPKMFRGLASRKLRVVFPLQGFVKQVQTASKYSSSSITLEDHRKNSVDFLRGRKLVPECEPPCNEDIDQLYQFIDKSRNLMVLTGAGISTESGIPDYRSPNGAYSTGFKPITHQEFIRSTHARRRYWARSYAGWKRFTAAQPGPAHMSLSLLESVGRMHFMVTQNVDRLHHCAGNNPLELHGSVYSVVCLRCGFSFSRHVFQDQVKALNPQWASAIESIEIGEPGSEKCFGMQQRPDGDIEINDKFWEEEFHIPNCQHCDGLLKPAVVFFGDNVPKDIADKAMEAAKECDSLLVLGSSLMTMSAFRLVRAAHEKGATIAIVNIGTTRADNFVPFKIMARCGEILPRLLSLGSLKVPSPNG